MNAPVPSRRQRRHRTQRRILVAARRLFLTRGYAATHVTEIAKNAGYTTGPLGKHYPHKHQLGHEVAETLTALAIRQLSDARPTDRSNLVTMLSSWANTVISHPEWIWFELGLATTAPEHRDRHTDRRQRIHAALTDLLATTIEPAPGSDLTITAAALLATLVGCTVATVGNTVQDHHRVRTQIELVLHATTEPAFPSKTNPDEENRSMSYQARTPHACDDIDPPQTTDHDHTLATTTPADDDSDVVTAVRAGLQAVRDD
ncbi:TetR/AcrR family transcriptional regulator [Nocardia sp. NPDC005366]|uniref:TetR/AcrR family transcriptional regulator n=1 Tax=Nocardia sp. NPDC005366 TaxID=3156878 RepID=UPI0033B19E78